MTTYDHRQSATLGTHDDLFARDVAVALPFVFDRDVTAVFDDMLARSVPSYAEAQRLIVDIAATFVAPGSRVYDLGCSLGTTALQLAQRDLPAGVEIVGVDSSDDMLREAEARLQLASGDATLNAPVQYDKALVDENYPMPDASVVIASLLLQFLRPLERPSLLHHIHESLRPGGAIVMLEKVVAESPRISAFFIDRYHDFKEDNGYSKEEIARKRTALENVLVPFQIRENLQLLRSAGFVEAQTFFQWLNFVGFVGLKSPT